LPTSTPPASTVQNQFQPAATSGKDQAADSRPAARITPAVSSSSAIAAPRQSGAQELATAEKYLNGNLGVTRDSGEAAQWLWKAVRKRNLEATLVLSDLYLRGDGVPKSCDQARLLLDAAARKGEKAAAERLRNLQAFGCQ
jgi:TPR repeat protein